MTSIQILIVCLTIFAVVAVICVFSYLGSVGYAKIQLAHAESIANSERALQNCKNEEIRRLQSQIEKILEKQPTVAIKNL
jgi:type II secretory pathway pseudopilin PulG